MDYLKSGTNVGIGLRNKVNNMYYKVVFKHGDKFLSCVVMDHWTVCYGVGKVSVPRVDGSKLMVFDNLYLAQDFANNFVLIPRKHLAIFECEVENPVRAYYVQYSWDRKVCFWVDFNSGVDLVKYKKAPDGTCFVDSVTLIREVDDVL